MKKSKSVVVYSLLILVMFISSLAVTLALVTDEKNKESEILQFDKVELCSHGNGSNLSITVDADYVGDGEVIFDGSNENDMLYIKPHIDSADMYVRFKVYFTLGSEEEDKLNAETLAILNNGDAVPQGFTLFEDTTNTYDLVEFEGWVYMTTAKETEHVEDRLVKVLQGIDDRYILSDFYRLDYEQTNEDSILQMIEDNDGKLFLNVEVEAYQAYGLALAEDSFSSVGDEIIESSQGEVLETIYNNLTVGKFHKVSSEEIFVSVKYNLNGGQGNVPLDAKQYLEGEVITIKFDEIPTRKNYIFLGWDTDPKAKIPKYKLNEESTIVAGFKTIKLYAIWEEFFEYSVTYNLNGGQGVVPVDNNVYHENYQVNVKFDNIPTKTNYVFIGWNTYKDAVTALYSVNGQTSFIINKNTILYAVWQYNYVGSEVAGLYSSSGKFTPWSQLVAEGLVTVTNSTLKNTDSLKNLSGRLVISDDVKNIEESAFENAKKLTSVVIPQSVTTIGDKAFNNCTNLSEIVYLAPNVSNVNSSSNCFGNVGSAVGGTKLYVGNNVETIPNNLFANSDIKSVSFVKSENAEIPNLKTLGESVFANCDKLVSVEFPESITKISSNAFLNCSNLKEAKLESVETLGNNVFKGCESLTLISLPNNIQSIGTGVFGDCSKVDTVYCDTENEALNDIYKEFGKDLKNGFTLILGDNITAIGENQFASTNVGTIDFSNATSLKEIKDSAFKGCENLKEINLPEGVTSIGAQAFKDCVNVEKLTIPSSVTSISEDQTFCNLNNLKEINYNATNCADFSNSASSIFAGSSKDNEEGVVLNIGNQVEKIPNAIFSNNVSPNDFLISKINIDENSALTEIGDGAFSNQKSLEEIFIPKNVSNVSQLAFADCDNVKTISVSKNNSTYVSENNGNSLITKEDNKLVVGCSSTIIPNTVKSIGKNAFTMAGNMKTLEIPSSVETIEEEFFKSSNLEEITINAKNCSVNENAYKNCNASNIKFNVGSNVQTLNKNTIPTNAKAIDLTNTTGLTTISEGAFDSVSCLKDVELPNNVKTIGNGAFNNCSNLESIKISKSVSEIGEKIFSGCNKLESIEVDSSNATFESKGTNSIIRKSDKTLVQGCKNSIINENVERIGKNAFNNIQGLTSVKIPNTLKQIESEAFNNCSSLQYLIINNDNLELEIDSNAFKNCNNLNNVYIISSEEDDDINIFVEDGNDNFNNSNFAYAYFSNKTNEFSVGDNFALLPTFENINTTPIYRVLDETIASVDSTGNVKCLKNGKTYVEASFKIENEIYTMKFLVDVGCKICYDANGGNINIYPNTYDIYVDEERYNIGDSAIVKYYSTSRSTYTFKGWAFEADATTPDFVYGDNKTIIVQDEVTTIYAVWEEYPKYKIIYNLGYINEEFEDSYTYYSGQSVSLDFRHPNLHRENATLLGWSESLSDPTPRYTSSSSYLIMPNHDVTLYAFWKMNTVTYKVQYYDNVSTTPILTRSYAKDSFVYLSYDKIPQRNGYIFLGWNEDKDATKPRHVDHYALSTGFTITSDKKFYAIWYKGSVAFSGGGTGTEEDPYKMTNVDDFKLLCTLADCEYMFKNEYFLLMNDIDFENYYYILRYDHGGFYGNFDGGNHTLKNLQTRYGIFGTSMYNSKLKNLKVENITSYSPYVFANHTSTCTFENITVTNANISDYGTYHYDMGIVNYATNSHFENISVYSTVFTAKASMQNLEICIGGIAGSPMYSTFKNCYVDSTSSVVIDSSCAKYNVTLYIGGIIGQAGYIEIYNSSNLMSIDVSNVNICYAGGIVGHSKYGELVIDECTNKGNISVIANEVVIGGLVGYYSSSDDFSCDILKSYNVGNLSSNNSSATSISIGGIIGQVQGITLIAYCYNAGLISYPSSNNNFASGCFFAYLNNKITVKKSIAMNDFNENIIKTEKGRSRIFVSVKYYKYNEEPTWTTAKIKRYLNKSGETTFVRDTDNINNGRPVLSWEVE